MLTHSTTTKANLKMLSLLIILSCIFAPIKGTSIVDYNMQPPSENVFFRATLTDTSTLEKWEINESLAGISQFHGKISIYSPNSESFDIFYHADRDLNRELIYENTCTLISYGLTSWSSNLPGVKNSLVNMALILGPSLIYRFDSHAFKWNQESESEEIRGIEMQSFSTTIGPDWKVIFYFNNSMDIDLDIGLTQPTRVVLANPKTGSTNGETVILDIYSLAYTDIDLHKLVEITPGIGCPLYFQPNRPLPEIKGSFKQVELIMTESKQLIDSKSFEQNKIKIFVDEEMNILRINSGAYGSPRTEALYDYDLGTGYLFDSSLCSCSPHFLTVDTPGIDSKGSFDLDQIFWVQEKVKYVGNIYLVNEWPYAVDCWESVQYNVSQAGIVVDKLVTTYYYATRTDSNGMVTHEDHSVPIAVIKNGYAKDYGDTMKLVTSQRRDINEFQLDLDEERDESLFQINECANSQKQRVILAMFIDSDGSDGLAFAEKNVNSLRQSIRKLVTDEIYLSPLRMLDIDISFADNRIKTLINFGDTLRLEDSFEKTNLTLDGTKLEEQVYSYVIQDAEDCLKFLSSNTENRAILYSSSSKFCIGIRDLTILSSMHHGLDEYTIFYIPFGNLLHLRKQIPLQDVYGTLSNRLPGATIQLIDSDVSTFTSYTYTLKNVADVTMDVINVHDKQPFKIFEEGSRLIKNQPDGLIVSIKVESFSDCYRACELSDQLDCSLFSYCYSSSGVYECLISSGLNLTSESKNQILIPDPECTVNKRNVIFNYKKVSSRIFSNLKSQGKHTNDVEDCAAQCYSSIDCQSFQFCRDNLCYFSSNQNQIITNISVDCDIYMPSDSHQFKLTGSRLQTNIVHTETGLTMDQCASFCYHWNSMDDISTKCKSFNFCSKDGIDSCQLTKYSVKEADIELTDTTYCYNYELINEEANALNQVISEVNYKINKRTTNGLIIVFIITGLAFGLATPFVLKKWNQKYGNNNLPMRRLT